MTAQAYDEFEMPDDDRRFIVRAMLTTSQATDLFLGDLIRRGYSTRTVDTYRRLLDKFFDRLPQDQDVSKVTVDDCRRFLDLYNRKAAGTRAHTYSVLSSFFKWLTFTEKVKRNPMDRLERPRRHRPEDLDVVTVSPDDVRALLAAAKPGAERLAVALAVYTGSRRQALSRLRLSDYDQDDHKLRFREKGGRIITKPMPDELVKIIDDAIVAGWIEQPDGYLIPATGYLSKDGHRDDRVIWRLIKSAADRAGVRSHVHALRAAFACFYLEQNPGDIESLKELMGHRSLMTTQVYLRKLDKNAAMDRVRSLSWADNTAAPNSPQIAEELLASLSVVGAGGFEPPSDDSSLYERAGTQRGGSA